MWIIVGVIVTLVILIFTYNWWTSESFDSKREKAEAIAELLPTQPSYVEYRDAIGSDVVEYTDVSRLQKPTVSNIEAVI